VRGSSCCLQYKDVLAVLFAGEVKDGLVHGDQHQVRLESKA
jgi:hypothetical protein